MKFIGAVLILGASLSASAVWNSSRREKIQEMDRLLAALKLMDSELNARGEALPGLFERVCASSEGNASAFFAALSQKMAALGDRPFQELWEEAVSEHCCELGKEEYRSLSSLGRILGRFPISVQHRELAFCIQKLDGAIQTERLSYDKDRKLVMPLAASTGMFLLLMLI